MSDPSRSGPSDEIAPTHDEQPAAEEKDARPEAAPVTDDAALDSEEEWEGVSLEELGAAYAKVMAESNPHLDRPETQEDSAEASADDSPPDDEPGPQEAEEQNVEDGMVTPEAIIEAALFVGHPENQPLKAKQLAGMIRDVSPKEVEQAIESLNASYREQRQAIRIIFEEGGYRITLAPEMEVVRRAFYGKIREARLSHGALEVLSLVAYQPGISAQKVQDQRGKESGTLLNQLVRRRLLEVRREKPEGRGRVALNYFPTERFLNLFDLSSLDDLPQVDEADVSPTL